MTMMMTCMIKLRMMMGPGKVDGQHVARNPMVEEPEHQRLSSVPDDDGVVIINNSLQHMMIHMMMLHGT